MEAEARLTKLVNRCQNGETAAFEELFEMYQPRLKYYVRRLDGDGSSTDDILQDIWLSVVKKVHKLKNIESFSVWLYRIARNTVYDRFRRKNRFIPLPEEKELPVSSDHEPTFDASDAERLHRAMGKLKPYHREVLTLCFIEQMPYQSIAEVIDCSIGTVRSRIYYAKQSLRQEMEKYNG
jgi:RNA polymerase sigma-70 factor (ECF subfamily)